MSKKIYCIAEFAPAAGHEQELFEQLMSLEPLTLRENGCLRYRVTRQITHPQAPTQSKFSIMFLRYVSTNFSSRRCCYSYVGSDRN